MFDEDFVFSWAESNATGELVHVDEVPRGKQCDCVCPNCKEPLVARQGEKNEHGFAHLSVNRGANLKICYMVTLFKLAEQIVMTKKKIKLPSYFGIYPPRTIEFIDVRIDKNNDREDRQPDLIATTKTGEEYVIEFILKEQVRHCESIHYKGRTCLEIDLRNQTLETLETFLIEEVDDRKWINNTLYFDRIVDDYLNQQKPVRLVNSQECKHCFMNNKCCAVKTKDNTQEIEILHNGDVFRLCKTKVYEKEEMEYKRKQDIVAEKFRKIDEEKKEKVIGQFDKSSQQESALRSCFNCEINLPYRCRDGLAYCGTYISYGKPQRPHPSCAQTCKYYRKKS